MQCLATCNLVDSPGSSELSWLLYYLARPQIKMQIECMETKLISFMQLIEIVGEPINILERISSSDIMIRPCCGRQVIQTICTNCGRSGESEETSFYLVNLPCSDARQTVESRLMDYYESDMD